MVKQKGMNTWKPVKLEGAITAESVEGLIGIEELSDYDLSSVLKSSKAQSKKRKLSNSEPTEVKKSKKKQDKPKIKKTPDKVDANKKQNLNNSSSEPGAFVRNPNSPAKKEKQPKTDTNEKSEKSKVELRKQSKVDTNKERQSKDNNQSNNDTKQEKSNRKKKAKKSKKDAMKKAKDKTKETDGESNKTAKKRKVEIGEIAENTDGDKEIYSVADLAAWSNLPLPEPLLQALADLGFTKPTQIQELTLAPAILGRRDILGAAETGSGKTLAFGLPILAGILNLKEEAKKASSKTGNEEQGVEHDSEDDAVASDDEISTEDGNEEILEEESENDQDVEDIEDDSDMEDDEVEIDDDENENNGDNEEEDDSEESDFEENEEEIENINENGIGCVRSINNIDLNESKTAEPRKPLYGLILTPTRELAVQVKNHLIALAKHTDIRIAVVLGGMAAVKQERLLSKGPEIVVATPGRLWELIQQGNPHLSQVDNIRYLAIDETDRMIEKYHFQELHHLLERLNMDETKRITRQNFVFSATLTMVHDLPRHLLKKKKTKARKSSKITKMTATQKLEQIIEMLGINNPKIVDVTQQSGTAKLLTECRINCAIEEKDYYVYYFLLRHPGRTLIFCNSIGCVKRLATLLSLLGCSSLPLHASMQQRQRLKNLERFRDDPLGVLVATDVAARGLDIPKVEHVLHYQTPRTSESYIHRSGRTARASEEGITVMLIEPNEVGDYVKVCRTLGRSEDIPVFPVFEKMLVAVRQRVNVARQLDKLELQARRTNSECGWLQKAANEMDIILDEDEFAVNRNEKEAAKLKRHISAIRKQLSTNLVKPIMPRGFSARYPTSSGELNIPLVQGDQSTQKALDVMKTAMEDGKKMKKKPRKLFKAKDRINAANKTEKINGTKLNVTNKKKHNVINKANKNKRKQKRRK